MSQWIDDLKLRIPDYAKDIRLNLDGVVLRSTLGELALPVALAAAFATGNKVLVEAISADSALPEVERNAALSAAALMSASSFCSSISSPRI